MGEVGGRACDAGQDSARQIAIGGRAVAPQAPCPLESLQCRHPDEGGGLGAWVGGCGGGRRDWGWGEAAGRNTARRSAHWGTTAGPPTRL